MIIKLGRYCLKKEKRFGCIILEDSGDEPLNYKRIGKSIYCNKKTK